MAEFGAATARASMAVVPTRRLSFASSVGGGPGGGARRGVPDLEFSLAATKARALRSLPADASTPPPPAFKRYARSATFDALLQSALLYFCALLGADALAAASARAAAASSRAEPPDAVRLAARRRELDAEAVAARAALAAPYATTLLAHADARRPRRDRAFFETLSAALVAALDVAFARLPGGGRRATIEVELGALLRGKHFNSAARAHAPPRAVDALTIAALASAKHRGGGADRTMHAAEIAALTRRPPSLPVAAATTARSPLVAARLAGNAQQQHVERTFVEAVGGAVGSATAGRVLVAPDGGAASQAATPRSVTSTATVTRASMIGGGGGGGGAIPSGSGCLSRALLGVAASLPESFGLPADEGYYFCCLLRRYLTYGPNLGLAPMPLASWAAAAGGGGGRASIMMAASGGAAASSSLAKAAAA